MMRVLVLTITAAVSLASEASGDTEKAALAALAQICLPASETSTAARDLAQQSGYSRDDAAPGALVEMFPLAEHSASFTVPNTGGKVHVVSTVMPPPASPYSCAVTMSGEAQGFADAVEAHLAQAGYRANEPKASDKVRILDYQKETGGSIDRVLGLFNRNPAGNARDNLVIAYRVGDWKRP